MTPKINGDKTAFPAGEDCTAGLTKREWFAGMALIGILANNATPFELSQNPTQSKYLVRMASYAIADEMLKEEGS